MPTIVPCCVTGVVRVAAAVSVAPVVSCEHDVGGLEIAMHHAAAMRFVQRVRNLRAQFQHLFQRQGALLETLRQRLALDALHHQIVDSVLMTDVVQHADVWMIQAGDGFCFALEPLLVYRIRRKLRGQNLDGNAALQPRITRTVHLAHSARTQRREDFVGPEFGARSKRHTWPRLYSGKARRVFNTALQRRSTPLLLEVTGDSAGVYAIVVGRRANRMLFRARSSPYR